MGTHPIFESDFDCLTDKMPMTNVIEPLIEQNSLPRLFSQSTCAICLYFNEKNESIYSCDHCNPARKTYFCYKHCYAIPEHREGHPNYHRVNDIFKAHMKEDFLNKISDTIRIFSSSLDEEKEGMKLNIQNVHSEVNSSMEKLVESFITELECHRRNISKEIEDVANTRINELNATLKRLEEIGDEQDPEAIQKLSEIEKNHNPKIGPFASTICRPSTALTNSYHFTSGTKEDINKYWRNLEHIQYYKYQASIIPDWCLRDIPFLSVPHPDAFHHGQIFRTEMHQMAKHFVRREKFEPINDVQTLVRLGGIVANGQSTDRANNNGQDTCGHRQFLVRGPDKIFRRVILRHLTEKYDNNEVPLAMEISFEPDDVQLEHIIRLLGNLTKSKVSYFYRKNHLNKRVNSLLYYPWNKAEMKKVENAIGRNQNYWKQQGVSKVTAKSRCTLVLTYLDYYDMEPILLNEYVLPRSMLIYKCPDQLKISEHYPPMSVEIWFDNSHPGKKKFFDPLRKQFLIPDTSHQMRQTLCQNQFFKIEFSRNLHKNLPHVWLGQVKCGGEDLNSKTENMSANKSGFQIL